MNFSNTNVFEEPFKVYVYETSGEGVTTIIGTSQGSSTMILNETESCKLVPTNLYRVNDCVPISEG